MDRLPSREPKPKVIVAVGSARFYGEVLDRNANGVFVRGLGGVPRKDWFPHDVVKPVTEEEFRRATE